MARPSPAFHGFIGQREIVAQVAPLVAAAIHRGEMFPTTLVDGSTGLGKTQLAYSIACLFRSKLYRLVAHKGVAALEWGRFVVQAQRGDVLYVDEAHALRPDVQEWIYRYIDEKHVPKVVCDEQSGRERIDGETTALECHMFFATDQPSKLLPALKSRIKLHLRFQDYSDREMADIIRQRASEKSIVLNGHAISLLVRASRGIPRRAGHQLDLLKLHYGTEPPEEFGKSDVRAFLEVHGIDENGFDRTDRRYLALLLERANLETPLRVVAAHLGLEASSIHRDVEPWLIKSGYLENSKGGGRILTPNGIALARQLAPEGETSDGTEDREGEGEETERDSNWAAVD